MDFSFPFAEPYPEQYALMQCIYDTIESSKIGILESPTGTGKSLSIICSVLTWLKDTEARIVDDLEEARKVALGVPKESPQDDWLEYFISQSVVPVGGAATNKSDSLAIYRVVLDRISRSKSSARGFSVSTNSIKPLEKHTHLSVLDEDVDFALDAYESDSDCTSEHNSGKFPRAEQIDYSEPDSEDESLDSLLFPKIIYCSRTHSQISQFVREIKSTNFKNARCVVLGSRKQLCINHEVNYQPLDSMISELCLEKQKPRASVIRKTDEKAAISKKPRKTKLFKTLKCNFHKVGLERDFADKSLSQVCDIEELVELGGSLQACPYYGTRRAVKNAQLVCLPYNMLVQKSIRESLGVFLKGNVVVIDEAHNLNEAVSGAHSAEVTYDDVVSTIFGVDAYLDRYNRVLGGKNLVYINLLRTTLMGWKKVLADDSNVFSKNSVCKDANKAGDEVLRLNDFLFRARLDNVNVMKLKRHINITSLVRKIGGYMSWKRQQAAESTPGIPLASKCNIELSIPSDCTGALRRVTEFLSCLVTNDDDGRIVICRSHKTDIEGELSAIEGQKEYSNVCSNSGCRSGDTHTFTKTSIKFILLNAASQFRHITENARSVILLGGTMQPFSHVTAMLFPFEPPERIRLASFGHVVSDGNVLPLIIGAGVSGGSLVFKHDTRFNLSLLNELGESLISLCQIVPFGCPCFFTSYKYMNFVLKYWKQAHNQTGETIFARINAVKRVLVESRDASSCEEQWGEYSSLISSGSGAILFCVIGGKMSEGINFSDNLARSVIVIGMPYPDSRDAILQEKLRFAEHIAPGSSSSVYESMCMKAVNQCIGRSIRHARDYASIILLDARYRSARVSSQFPEWIRRCIKYCHSIDAAALSQLAKFYGTRLPQA